MNTMKIQLKLVTQYFIIVLLLCMSNHSLAASNILFIGNSFTFQGPVPEIVRHFALSDGFQAPVVAYLDDIDGVGGTSLEYRSTHVPTLQLINQQSWDYVVLQELSSRPTLQGDPGLFKISATTLFDVIKGANPDSTVFLYETWARHADHSDYQHPQTYSSPEDMQQQLREHYNDAVNNYIPNNSLVGVNNDLFLSPVGDAWELNYQSPNPINLHGGDLLHANQHGYYLNALMLYGSIYQVSPIGLPTSFSITDKRGAVVPYNIDVATANLLQDIAFETLTGSPPEKTFIKGDSIVIDFGSMSMQTLQGMGFNNIINSSISAGIEQKKVGGGRTNIAVKVSGAFEFINSNGLDQNVFSYPASASSDSFATGSFTSHTVALDESGQITISNLNPEHKYTVKLFASREGDDSGRGRLTRYQVNNMYKDLEVSDNQGNQIVFSGLTTTDSGELIIDVMVSPNGLGRFAYLGVLELISEGSQASFYVIPTKQGEKAAIIQL